MRTESQQQTGQAGRMEGWRDGGRKAEIEPRCRQFGRPAQPAVGKDYTTALYITRISYRSRVHSTAQACRKQGLSVKPIGLFLGLELEKFFVSSSCRMLCAVCDGD